jgi:peroxiredoxin
MRSPQQYVPGAQITGLALAAISGERVAVPDGRRLTHLQLRRFASCPICDLHLSSFKRRHDEIEQANIREVVVFHSRAKEIATYEGDLPFALITDPDKRLYAQFGVETSPQALLDPRVWPFIVAGLSRSLAKTVATGRAAPHFSPEGGRLVLPADFLIGTDGRVLACKYAEHASDQWSGDELIRLSQKQA